MFHVPFADEIGLKAVLYPWPHSPPGRAEVGTKARPLPLCLPHLHRLKQRQQRALASLSPAHCQGPVWEQVGRPS